MALKLLIDQDQNQDTKEIIMDSENPALISQQRVLKASEVAKLLNLDHDSALTLLKKGVIPSFRFGRQYRTSYLSCLRFIDNCLNSGTDIKTLL